MAGKIGREIYNTRQWLYTRREAIKAAGFCCRECGRADGLRLHVHHKRALHRGGAPFALKNLNVLCRACHAAKHVKRQREGPKPAWALLVAESNNPNERGKKQDDESTKNRTETFPGAGAA